MRIARLVAWIVVWTCLSVATSRAERQVALVIGNANYQAANISLSNPRNDAQDVSAVLATIGFEVVTALDATKRDMDLAVVRFARLATGADSALFFYSGHAMQFQGRNYLLPIDAALEDEISVRYQTVALEEVRAALDRTNGVKIMILDASRNNPLADRLEKRIIGASRRLAMAPGLARIDKIQGFAVAYATAPDEVAQNGQGRNSPFTAALLKRLQEPGLEIETMFRRVAADVNAQTGGRQRPEAYISLSSEYYLNQSDRIAWERIRDLGDAAALRDFVSKYPSSPHGILARQQLERLERIAKEREEQARRAREEEQRRAEQLALRRMDEERKRQEAARQQALRQEAPRQQQEQHKGVAALQETASQQQADSERKRTEENCRREEAKLAEFQAAGAAAREQLGKFEIEVSCEALRPRITAAIAALTAVAPATQKSGIPEFPWPPPAPSARYVIPRSLLVDPRNSGDASLSDVIRKLERALDSAEYFERSFFAAPEGIAMITRMERIKRDGTPDYNRRWITVEDNEAFSLANYIKGLLFYDPGYFRLIAFVVTNKPFTATGGSISAREGSDLLARGVNFLPSAVSDTKFSSDHTCTALIYEFRKIKNGQATQMNPSDLPARTHLERAMVWAAFGSSARK